MLDKTNTKTKRLMFGLISFSMLGCFAASANAQSGELIKRENIAPKYTWNLKDIYQEDQAWENDFSYVQSRIDGLKNFEGKLSKSPENLLACLKYTDDIQMKLQRLSLYASCSRDLDLNNQKFQGMYDRLTQLSAMVSRNASFIDPEILGIPEGTLKKFIDGNSELAVYGHALDNLLRRRAHRLPKEQEELMALAGPLMQVPYDAFSIMKDAEIQYPKVKDESGKEIQISDGRYYAALQSHDRNYRETVYRGYYKPYMAYKNTFCTLFNGNIKALTFDARARKYKDNRSAAMDVNNIPTEVYDNLVNSVDANLAPLHRWAELKKRVLGLNDFHAYDTYVSLFPGVNKKYSFDEAKEIVLKALAPMGKDYIANLKNAFDNRWVDVYETKAKRSGAYSSGVSYGVHPYVLLNWNDNLEDVFTLAHEMGHNMHSLYTEKNQPFPYADYSIFLAEMASTCNENLLLNYLLKNSQSKEEKLALIEKYLNNATTTFYRQTRFAEYEKLVNDMAEKGEALTADTLSALYGQMYQKYWGPVMTLDKEEASSWSRIPHFYYDFYVYSYATGFAASSKIASMILEEGQPAVDRYMKYFLKGGSSEYPIDLLKKVGVDMTKPDAVMAVVNTMNSRLDELEKLISEK